MVLNKLELTIKPLSSLIIGMICAILGFVLGVVTSKLEKLERRTPIKVKEKVEPKYVEMNKTIVTVSSGAIVVTFSLMSLLKPAMHSVPVIIAAIWFFVISILLGTVVQFAAYLGTKLWEVGIDVVDGLEKEKGKGKKIDEDVFKDLFWMMDWMDIARRIIGVLPFLQLLTFITAFILLAIFTTTNIMQPAR